MHPDSDQFPRRVLRPRGEGGFTLIELLIVITILGILAAVVIFAVRGAGDDSERNAAAADARILRTAEETYCARHGRYATVDELRGLVPTAPNGTKKFISSKPKSTVILGDRGECGAVGDPNTSIEAIFNPSDPTSVRDKITVGNNPQAIAVDSDNQRLYVANAGSGTVSVINTANTGAAPQTVDDIPNPTSIAVNPQTRKVYVGQGSPTGGITVINGANNQKLGTIGASAGVQDVVTSTGNDDAYACAGDRLLAIDKNSNSAVKDSEDLGAPCGLLAVRNRTNKVYTLTRAGTGTPNALKIYDGDSGSLSSITTSDGIDTGLAPAIAVDQDSGKVYAAGTSTHRVSQQTDPPNTGRLLTVDSSDAITAPEYKDPLPPSTTIFRYMPVFDPGLGAVFAIGLADGGRYHVGRFQPSQNKFDKLQVIGAVGGTFQTAKGAVAIDAGRHRVYVARGNGEIGLDVVDGQSMDDPPAYVDFPADGPPLTRQAYAIAVDDATHAVYVTSNSTPGYVRVLR